MADFDSSLPIRTENAGDVISKIADATTPSQQLKVNVDGSIDVNAALSAGSEVIITDGTDDLAINADGSLNAVVTATNLDIRDLVFATDKVDVSGSEVSLDAGTLAALESITVQNGAGGAAVNIQDGGNSITVDATALDIRPLTSADVVTAEQGTSPWVVSATDLDIRDLAAASDSVAAHLFDETGAAFSSSNPLPVEFFESQTEAFDYNTSASVAGGASSTHTYAAASGFKLYDVKVSGSGKLKAELRINGVTVAVGFNSTANPDIEFHFQKGLNASGVNVAVVRTNRDGSSQDVYSSIVGVV